MTSAVCSETSIQKKHLPTTVNNVIYFSVMKTYPTSVNNVVLFSVMETDYSTTLIIVCSETSLQQKRLHTSVNNVVLFSVMETEPTSVNNVVLFFSYGDRLLNHFNYCMQWKLTPTETSSHFSEQCGNFFQLWRQITQAL